MFQFIIISNYPLAYNPKRLEQFKLTIVKKVEKCFKECLLADSEPGDPFD